LSGYEISDFAFSRRRQAEPDSREMRRLFQVLVHAHRAAPLLSSCVDTHLREHINQI
jgi:hypothetical protein